MAQDTSSTSSSFKSNDFADALNQWEETNGSTSRTGTAQQAAQKVSSGYNLTDKAGSRTSTTGGTSAATSQSFRAFLEEDMSD